MMGITTKVQTGWMNVKGVGGYHVGTEIEAPSPWLHCGPTPHLEPSWKGWASVSPPLKPEKVAPQILTPGATMEGKRGGMDPDPQGPNQGTQGERDVDY